MSKTGRNLLSLIILWSVPGLAAATEAGPSAKTNFPPIIADVAPRAPDRPMASNPVIVDDPRNPSLLPEWHPQGMGDRVSLAMQADFPGAQLTLNVRF
jgi:hypothetical protein